MKRFRKQKKELSELDLISAQGEGWGEWYPNQENIEKYDSDQLKIPSINDFKVNQEITASLIKKPKKLRNIGSCLRICTNADYKYAINAGLETRIYFKDSNNNIHSILTVYNDCNAFGVFGEMNSEPSHHKDIIKWALREGLIKINYKRIKVVQQYIKTVSNHREEVKKIYKKQGNVLARIFG